MSRIFFDNATTGESGGTLCYYYLGPYLPQYSPIPPTYRIGSIAQDGTIVTGKARTIFEVGEPFNNPYKIFRDGDPPHIWTINHNNIFYFNTIQSTEVSNDIQVAPSVNAYYIIIVEKTAVANARSLRISIYITGATRQLSQVRLPSYNGPNFGPDNYGELYNPRFSSVMFELSAGVNYTIRVADPVGYSEYRNRLSEELVVESVTRRWDGRDWVTTTSGNFRNMKGYPTSI
jgi:hypothetical protein